MLWLKSVHKTGRQPNMIICQSHIHYFILLGSTPTFDVEPLLLSDRYSFTVAYMKYL